MANKSAVGRLSAETLLQVPSEREALDLNDQPSTLGASRVDSRHSSVISSQRFTWWKRHVRISVPHDVCRDHFGEVLSTFLLILMTMTNFDIEALADSTNSK